MCEPRLSRSPCKLLDDLPGDDTPPYRNDSGFVDTKLLELLNGGETMYRVDRIGEPTNWNEAAEDAVERIAAHLSRLQRSVLLWWNDEFSIVFGNDGYDSGRGRRPRIDQRAQLEVHLLRQ